MVQLTTTDQLIADAIAARDATIPLAYRLPKAAYPLPKDVSTLLSTSGIMDAKELALVELDATALAAAIASKQYTAVQATRAYCKAAALAQQGTNCLVEMFEDEALERAAWLDAQQANGTLVGPFHGVPVSIKDHINVKGHDSPSGFLGLVGKMMAEEDAHLVSVLREAGAVFYCKTTNPQSLMHLETDCYLGQTSCPFNTDLTAGGSSGGEGAIIGMKASPFGIGTDIGGSIRSPAAACGVYSFKPSVGRVPFGGCMCPVWPLGYEGILGTHGPMGRSVRDMELYFRLFSKSEPWLIDPTLHVKPFREITPKRKLRVAILRDDGVVAPVAPIRRALDAAVAKLKANSDFELVEWTPYKSAECWDIISKLYWAADKGSRVYEQCANSGEPVRPLTKWVIDEGGPAIPEASGQWDLVARRDAFRFTFAEYWRAANIDVVLSPVGPTPAPKHDTARYWNYTSYWNLVNYPAGVFPTGLHVEASIDAEDPNYKPRNDREAYVRDNYKAEECVGAPLCLQVIGFCGLEEETLDAFKRIDAVVRA